MASKTSEEPVATADETLLDAWLTLRAALRDDARLRHDLELWCTRLQRHTRGPLTDFLAAVVGE